MIGNIFILRRLILDRPLKTINYSLQLNKNIVYDSSDKLTCMSFIQHEMKQDDVLLQIDEFKQPAIVKTLGDFAQERYSAFMFDANIPHYVQGKSIDEIIDFYKGQGKESEFQHELIQFMIGEKLDTSKKDEFIKFLNFGANSP